MCKLVLILLTVDVKWVAIIDIVLNFKLIINHCIRKPEDRQLNTIESKSGKCIFFPFLLCSDCVLL